MIQDLKFFISNHLKYCIEDGFAPETQDGIKKITNRIKTKLWVKYKEEVSDKKAFSNKEAFWQYIKNHKGGCEKIDAAIHGCLGQESYMRWALSVGLCDGLDTHGRSVLHASSLAQNTDVSRQAILLYLKWKDKQNSWKLETKASIASFIALVTMAEIGMGELYLEMAQILEKHQPLDMASEYTQKIKNKKVLITFGTALWMGAGRPQSVTSRNKWLEQLDKWENTHGWTKKEIWYLTVGFEKLPLQLQSVLLSSKSKVEHFILNQKCTTKESQKYENVGLAL